MGLLSGRGRAKDGPEATPDDDLTMLTVEQAQRLRELVRTAFAERGVEVTVLADHLRDADGREYGLWNLAANVSGERDRRWPRLVEEHVGALLRMADQPTVEDLGDEEVLAAVHLRLHEADGVPDRSRYAYAGELVPGVLELLALDLPETVELLDDEVVGRLGEADLRRAALRNLQAVDGLELRHLRTKDGADVSVVLGESFFTASLVADLPALLARFGETDLPDGVLVAMPYRHQVAFHLPRDASVVPSLQALVGFALDGFSTMAGPLSPWVYWWRDGTWLQLSEHGEDEQVRVGVPPELAEVLERLVR